MINKIHRIICNIMNRNQCFLYPLLKWSFRFESASDLTLIYFDILDTKLWISSQVLGLMLFKFQPP